jgi:hypothetical protein
MNIIRILTAAAFIITSHAALAECEKPGTPQKIEGQVSKVDAAQGKITVKDSNGKTHVFDASADAVQKYKNGDPIKMSLRCEK